MGSNLNANDCATVSPTVTTTYTLTATNATGQIQANVTVNVGAVRILSFTANPVTTEAQGAPVTLAWTTQNAQSVVLIGADVPPAKVTWRVHDADLIDAGAPPQGVATFSVPGSYVPLAETVVCHRDPERFALFSAVQHAAPSFPFRPFRSDTIVSWVAGFAVPGGAHAFLPAQLVYMPWRRGAPDETRIGHATSSGLACGPTLEEAVLAGLLELV